jgi:hypothetical protein
MFFTIRKLANYYILKRNSAPWSKIACSLTVFKHIFILKWDVTPCNVVHDSHVSEELALRMETLLSPQSRVTRYQNT